MHQSSLLAASSRSSLYQKLKIIQNILLILFWLSRSKFNFTKKCFYFFHVLKKSLRKEEKCDNDYSRSGNANVDSAATSAKICPGWLANQLFSLRPDTARSFPIPRELCNMLHNKKLSTLRSALAGKKL